MNPCKKKRSPALLAMILIVLVAAVAGIGAYFMKYGMTKGMRAYRLIQNMIHKKELATDLTVNITYGNEKILLCAEIDRTQLDGKEITSLRQNGNALYYCDHVVFMKNGKAYKLGEADGNKELPLGKALKLYRLMEVGVEQVNGKEIYSMTADGTDAVSALEIVAPALAVRFADLDSITIRLVAGDGGLEQVQILSNGRLNEKNFSLNAELVISEAFRSEIPAQIQAAITSGEYEITTMDARDLIALVNAWNTLNAKQLLCTELNLTADCGPLKINESLQFFRDASGKTDIFALQKNGYCLYFTKSRVCDKNGLSVSTDRKTLVDVARLLDMAYALCMNGELAVSENGVYTIVLDEEGMQKVAEAVAPATVNMNIRFHQGKLQVCLLDGTISSVAFNIDGSVKVVVADVPVSFAGELAVTQEACGFEIPEVVRRTLDE